MQSPKNFALIGAAGYIAPRHMHAIKETGNRLVAALDPSDSVGVIDGYFPDSSFFTEFERFDRHVDKMRRSASGDAVDYVSICSPNYLHDSHIRFALRSDADAICEKPIALNPRNIEGLIEAERATGRRAWTILQLRLHPEIMRLREKFAADAPDAPKREVELTYITGRGTWYIHSWKGDDKKSGGIATNIGVHFFDMLGFLFGALQDNRVHVSEPTRASGYLEYERARVRWFLSIDVADIPEAARSAGQRTFRSITVDGDQIEFSGGFTDLHVASYQQILAGNGFALADTLPAIETVAAIREAVPQSGSLSGDRHPLIARSAG